MKNNTRVVARLTKGGIGVKNITTSVNTQGGTEKTPQRNASFKMRCALPTIVATASALLSFTLPALAEYKSEFIPFPQVTYNSNDKNISEINRHNTDVGVDFLYTANVGQARVLAEYFVNHDERDMERLTVGWAASDDTRIWFGRYHTALGPWNHKYHHGAYLQPTIYRPGVIEFEDTGGVIPAHATGVTMGTLINSTSHTTHFTLDVGLGPELIPHTLRALDILNPAEGQHDLSMTLAVSRRSFTRMFDDQGLFIGLVRIPSSVPGISQVEQHIIGGYSNITFKRLTLTDSVLWVDVNLELADKQKNSSFGYAYIQPEYFLSSKWTAYGRVESTVRGGENLYLQQIPAYIRQRSLIGARYQFSSAQAFKIELAALEQYGTHFNQIAVQWSAAIP